jgi:hypothetical protein
MIEPSARDNYSHLEGRCFDGRKMVGKKMKKRGSSGAAFHALFSCHPYSCQSFEHQGHKKARESSRAG